MSQPKGTPVLQGREDVSLYRCNECGHRMPGIQIRVVRIPHPKKDKTFVAVEQCPECGEVECFTAVCDEPGCARNATCGWPSPDGGYRNTCGKHMPESAR